MFLLDPDATLDFAFDWSRWLEEGETITTQTVVGTGVAVSGITQTDGLVTYWLSQGEEGTSRVTCHIETSMGRADDRSVDVRVVDR